MSPILYATLLYPIAVSNGRLGFLPSSQCSYLPECLESRLFVHYQTRPLESLYEDLLVGPETEIRLKVDGQLQQPLIASNWSDLYPKLQSLPVPSWIGKNYQNCNDWTARGTTEEGCTQGYTSTGNRITCDKLRQVYCACKVFAVTQPPTLSPTFTSPSFSPSTTPSLAPITVSPSMSPSTTRPSRGPTVSSPTGSPSSTPSSSSPSRNPTTPQPTNSPSKTPTVPTSRAPTTSPSFATLWVSAEKIDAALTELVLPEVEIWLNTVVTTPIPNSLLTPTAFQSTTQTPTPSYGATKALDGIKTQNSLATNAGISRTTDGLTDYWRVQVPGGPMELDSIFRIRFWPYSSSTNYYSSFVHFRVRRNAVTNPAVETDYIWSAAMDSDTFFILVQDFYPSSSSVVQTPKQVTIVATYSPSTPNIAVREINFYHKKQPQLSLKEHTNGNDEFPTNSPSLPVTNAFDKSLSTYSLTNGAFSYHWLRSFIGYLDFVDLDRIEICDASELGFSLVGRQIYFLTTSFTPPNPPFAPGDPRVFWSFTIQVDSTAASYCHSYRPTDVESSRWLLQQKLQGQSPGDQFGGALDVTDDESIAVIESSVADSGYLRLYSRHGERWSPISDQFTATGLSADSLLGSSLSIWGNVIAAGAPGHNTERGATVIFRLEAGVPIQSQVIESDPTLTFFPTIGTSVSLHDGLLAVGCPGDAAGQGAILMYQDNGTQFVRVGAPIRITGLAGQPQIGTAVSVWNNMVAFSSGDSTGYVWVFQLNASNEFQQMGSRLQASATISGYKYFGAALSLHGGRLAVGCPRENANVGSVYLFELSGGTTWVEIQRLVGSNPVVSQFQGTRVSLRDEYLAVGAPSLGNGSIYIYRFLNNTFREIRHLEAQDFTGSDIQQGISVCIRNVTLMFGSQRDESMRGAVWSIARDNYASRAPTRYPTNSPTISPSSAAPSRVPTVRPSMSPTSSKPTFSPTRSPTSSPSTTKPSFAPTTSMPSRAPTTSRPSGTPTVSPTTPTTRAPSVSPSSAAMWVSLERPSLTSGYINVAEMQIFMNSNPNTALAAPTLAPTAAQSSTYSSGPGNNAVPVTPAPVAVDGSTAGAYNYGPTTSQLAFTNAVVERSWWRVQIPGTSYRLEDIFRLAYWGRTDGCCAYEMISPSQGVQVRVRSNAVTDPSSLTGVLYTKQLSHTYITYGAYYYPNSQFETLDTFISLERPTFSPTQATIQINELRVYMKSQPNINIAQGYYVLGQESTLSPSFPATNAVDGNVATFSHTSAVGGAPWWIQYLGSLYYGDIDRIEFVNRDCCESMVDAWLRIRNSSVQGYSPNTLDTSNVLWQFQIKVISPVTSFGHSYRPVDVENTRWVTQRKLLQGAGLCGYSVAMNQNESVMVVGCPFHGESDTGGIWVYHSVNLLWMLHSAALSSSAMNGFQASQGVSVDIFDSTIVVGAQDFLGNTGSLVIWEWDGISQWYEKQWITPSDISGKLGVSVAIHGTTIVAGATTDSSSVGAAAVYVRNASGLYVQQGLKLVGTGRIGASQQGYSVTIWGDTIAVGGPQDNSGVGAVWVFTRSGTTWSQQGSKLTASGTISINVQFGTSVALQRDILVVGAQSEHQSSVGAAFVFTRAAGVWTQQARLTGSNPILNHFQGRSVYIWNDYIAVGAAEGSGVGSVYIYKQTGATTWREVRHVAGSGNIGVAGQGLSVCLRNLTLAMGGPYDNSNTGAIWTVYRDPIPPVTDRPSRAPTTRPSASPTRKPTQSPSRGPSRAPSGSPSTTPTRGPSLSPTLAPTFLEAGLWNTQEKFTGQDSLAIFGYSIAINSNDSIAVVGAYGYNSYQGAIYVYRKYDTIWIRAAGPLTCTGCIGTPYFGFSVAIWDSTIVVGAIGDDSFMGTAVVFDYDGVSTWTQTQILKGTDPISIGRQGESVAIYGDTLVFGAPQDTFALGCFYIFTRVAGVWSQFGDKYIGTGYDPDVYSRPRIGTKVAIFNDTIVTTAVRDTTNRGAMWIFKRNSTGYWNQLGGKIVPTGALGSQSYFGNDLSVNQDYIIVGAPRDNTNLGAVYVFDLGGTQLARLTSQTQVALQSFGASVSIRSDYLAIGLDRMAFSEVGSIYLFKLILGTWTEAKKLVGSGNIGNSDQGFAVAMGTETVMFGGYADNSSVGAIWVVYKNPTPPPTLTPSRSPTLAVPSLSPTTSRPSRSPSTSRPSTTPSVSPSLSPSLSSPSRSPTRSPSTAPNTAKPSRSPSVQPSLAPTVRPSLSPTFRPTLSPTVGPSRSPTVRPSLSPTVRPSLAPSFKPSLSPTVRPSRSPSVSPSKAPTSSGTSNPSRSPTRSPSLSPTTPTTRAPSSSPSLGSLFLSLETTTVGNNPIEVAELAIYTNTNPGTAISSPTLTPTVAQSSNFSPTQFQASKAVDGVTAGVAASDQVSITGAVSERAWLRVQVPGTGLIGVDHIFKIVLFPRTDVCCRTNLRDRNVRLRLRSSAVTDPSSSSGILLDKQIQVQYADQPINYYPSKDFTVEDLYLTIERTASPTATTIEVMELEVYMKSQPDRNVISGFTVFCTQDSEFPGFPCGNAFDGSYSTFTSTASSIGQHFLNVYMGAMAWQDIHRISLYFRTAGNSMIGAFVRIRASTSAIPYTSITVTDTSNVRYSATITVASSVDTIPFTYIPYGLEEPRWSRQIKYLGTSASGIRLFGFSCAINQNESVAIVGGYSTSSNAGRVWIFHRNESSNTWVQQGADFRSPSFTGTTSKQGYSVAAYDSTVAWGATGDFSGAGKGFVWQWDGVSAYYEVAVLSPSGICTTTACAMGTSTAMHGDYLVFGARLDAGGEGSLLVYKRTSGTWAFQQRLTQSDGLTGNLGRSVAMHENTIVGGGAQRNTLRGAAWVFVRDTGTDTWSQQGSVLIPTGLTESGSALRCGIAVSVFSDWLGVGCTNHLNNIGAIVMYNRTGTVWTQRQILTGSNPASSLGTSVSIWHDYLFAGGGGIGYIFRLISGSWIEVKHISPVSQTGSSGFGTSASLRNRTAMVGGYTDNAVVGAIWVIYRDP